MTKTRKPFAGNDHVFLNEFSSWCGNCGKVAEGHECSWYLSNGFAPCPAGNTAREGEMVFRAFQKRPEL